MMYIYKLGTSCVDNNDDNTAKFKQIGDNLENLIVNKGGQLSKTTNINLFKIKKIDELEDI